MIAAAEREAATLPAAIVDPEHLRLARELEALPENQDGADKSWLWPAYEFCRRHFRRFEPS